MPTKTVSVSRQSSGVVLVAVPPSAKVVNFLSIARGAGVDIFDPGVEVSFLSDPKNLSSLRAFITGQKLIARYQGRMLIPDGTKAIAIFNPSHAQPLACTVVFELA